MSLSHSSTTFSAKSLCVVRRATYQYHAFYLASTTVTDKSTLAWFTILSLALSLPSTKRSYTKQHTRDRDDYFVILPSKLDASLICTLCTHTTSADFFLPWSILFFVFVSTHPFSTLRCNAMAPLPHKMAYCWHQLKFSGHTFLCVMYSSLLAYGVQLIR